MAHEKMRVQWWRMGLARWGGGLRELAVFGSIYGSYRLASGALPHTDLLAFQNAYNIVSVERHLGFFVEQGFQSLFLGSTFLMQLANAIYTVFYYPALIIFGIWAYNRHREQYFTVRNIFAVSAGLAFLCFALYPVAPPRLLPGLGIVDTMAQYGTLDYGSPGLRSITNPYAAMPSLHCGWTLLVGIATVHIARAWWLKLLGVLLPFGMLVATVATGNHFILDAIGGTLVIGLAYGLVLVFTRFRERVNVFGRLVGVASGEVKANGGRV
jgi:membrane-associated phospholipid phosphatase